MIIKFLENLKAKGWTQKAIASKIGIGENQICRFLQGRTCTIETLVKISKAFNVSTDEVLGLDRPEPKPRDNTIHDSGITRRAGAEERI